MQRKEPTLSSTIVPDQDDKIGGSGGGQMPPPPPAQGSSGGGFLVIFALVVAVAALGGSGYLAWQQQEAQVELERASQRIQQLENRLEMTSDDASESVAQIQEKLDWADSEIRKLWGVSYDTNRGHIRENRENIAQLTRDLSSARETGRSAKELAESVQSDVREAREAARRAAARVDDAISGAEEQRQRVESLANTLSRLQRQLDGAGDLAQRVAENEEAIEAIDSYRRSINRDLLQLREQVRGLD